RRPPARTRRTTASLTDRRRFQLRDVAALRQPFLSWRVISRVASRNHVVRVRGVREHDDRWYLRNRLTGVVHRKDRIRRRRLRQVLEAEPTGEVRRTNPIVARVVARRVRPRPCLERRRWPQRRQPPPRRAPHPLPAHPPSPP